MHTLSLKTILGLELANPMVEPHIQYYPELSDGRQVYKLSQSTKWLMELGPDTRAQMVRHGTHDYYLHELVQLHSSLIVIPKYFYESKGEMFARCATPEIGIDPTGRELMFIIPKDLPFSSPVLKSHNLADFKMEYPLMKAPDGSLMSTLCGNRIYGWWQ